MSKIFTSTNIKQSQEDMIVLQNMNKSILYIVSLFLLPFWMNGQNKYHFDHITAKEGLSDNYVESIVQDSLGYVWIATTNGLNVYDGLEIKQYFLSPDDSSSIPNNNIQYCYLDSKNQIWILTQSMVLCRYNREKDSFARFPLKKEKSNIINSARRIVEYNDSIFIVGTLNGLCVYNINSRQEKWYYNTDFGYSGHDIRGICKDSQKNIWFVTEDVGGLFSFDIKTKTIKSYFDKNDSIFQYLAISQLTDSTLALGTYNKGLYEFNFFKKSFKKISFPDLQFDNGFTGCYNITNESEDICWISTSSNDGVVKYNLKTKETLHIQNDNKNSNGFNSSSISSIMRDNQGNVWFGSHGGGLNVLNVKKSIFKSYTIVSEQYNLAHNLVSCFEEDELGNYWIGTDGGGLHYFDVKNENVTHFNSKNSVLSNSIIDLEFDRINNVLYISSWDGGLFSYNCNTRSFSTMKDLILSPKSYPFFNLKGIKLFSDTLFLNTHFEGLLLYDIKNKKLITESTNQDPKLNRYFKKLYANNTIKDYLGNIWVYTIRGLYKIEKDTSYLLAYSPSDKTSLNDNYIANIFADSKNRLWIGTSKGLNLYNYESNSFIRLDELYGLNFSVKSIIEDKNGMIWLGTGSGLVCLDPETYKYKTYTVQDGLLDNQFFKQAVYKNSKNQLLFGTLNGFLIFNPNDIKPNRFTPPVYFTDFKLFNASQNPRNPKSVLKSNINCTSEIILNHNQNFITIEYTSIDFCSPNKIKYAYMMEGVDNDWVYVNYNRSANYTSLQSGSYIFKVKSTNSDGIWCDNLKTIHITILTPWWKTWWFITFSVLFVFLIIGLIYFMRVQRIKKINKFLKIEVLKQTQEIQTANSELINQNEAIKQQSEIIGLQNKELDVLVKNKDRLFSIIGHDLKNPLNAIIGFSGLISRNLEKYETEKIQKFIKAIESSSLSMYELLENILLWARSQTGKSSLNATSINLREIAENNVLLYNHACEKKEISLAVECSYLSIEAYADYNMIDTVVRNLINNSVKFTKQGGKILVYIYENDNWSIISVKDNGIGMSDSTINDILSQCNVTSNIGTNKEKGTGLGFGICIEFTKSNKGHILIDSVEDRGTEIFLCIHKNAENYNAEMQIAPTLEDVLNKHDLNSVQHSIIAQQSNLESIKQFQEFIARKKILIVDDNPIIRAEIVEIFTESNVTIFEAPNGRIGFELTVAEKPDIIITDIVMPIMNGIEFCNKIKKSKHTSHIPVIILSAEKNINIEQSAIMSGASKYLYKPSNKFSILKAVYDCLIPPIR